MEVQTPSPGGSCWLASHVAASRMRYNRQLMIAILHDKVQIACNVNATVILLGQDPWSYQNFDMGAAKKYIPGPAQHGGLTEAPGAGLPVPVRSNSSSHLTAENHVTRRTAGRLVEGTGASR
jgi:hypothetical protein